MPLEAQVSFYLSLQTGGLRVQTDAPFYGDPPPAGAGGPCEGLWDFEVVELFIAHGETYTELELGPHGHYLLLRLQGVRQMITQQLPLSFYDWKQRAGRWQGDALIPWVYLPPEPWTFNAYAMHGQGDARQYLALFALTGIAPDFHRLECFQPLNLRDSASSS